MADEYENKVKPQELRELAEALLDCGREIKHIVAPLLKYDFCQRTLYNLLQDCTSGKDPLGRPREKKNFPEYLASHGVRFQMEKLAEEVRANPEYGKTVNDQWWAGVRLCRNQPFGTSQNFDHVSIATSRRAQRKSIKKARFALISAQPSTSSSRP